MLGKRAGPSILSVFVGSFDAGVGARAFS